MATGGEVELGFVRAACTTCGRPDVWLTCNACKKSDRFRMSDDGVVCECGQKYDRATCTCGVPVPAAQLLWVEFTKGPLSLADWEWDRTRLAFIAGGAILVVGAAVAVGWHLL